MFPWIVGYFPLLGLPLIFGVEQDGSERRGVQPRASGQAIENPEQKPHNPEQGVEHAP